MSINNRKRRKIDYKKFDVIGIGCSAWDLSGIVENYPEPGEKSRINTFKEQGGGQIGTAIVTVARLGGRGAIVDTIGDDIYGEKIRKNFKAEGVDETYLFTDPQKTSLVSFCIVSENTGDRTIFYTTGSKRLLKPEDISRNLIVNCKCLIVDNHHGKISGVASKWAREAEIPIVTDIERDNPYNDEIFRYGTHHVLPQDYLIKYTREKNLESGLRVLYKEYKPEAVIVTCGEKGSIAFEGEDLIYQKAYKVKRVVDTTGAGDVFHGSFAYGLISGYSLSANLKFSSLISGLKCKKLGGQAGIPHRKNAIFREKYFLH